MTVAPDLRGRRIGRLRAIEIELDQAWDLLRQRDARKEFGQDPAEAAVRSPEIVERYEG